MLLVLLATGLWMLKTDPTSADLVAERKVQGNNISVTTLSFASIDTANFSQLINFFNTNGLVPGGFDTRAVRIEKDGKMDVTYTLQTTIRGESHKLCDAIDLQIIRRDLTQIYNGKLMKLNFQNILKDGDLEEWVFFISLSHPEENLKQKKCDFDIYMRTYRNTPDEALKGIYATRTLKNSVSSGTW